MTASALEQSLREVISQVGQTPKQFSDDADFYNDLGLDSFRMVEIFLAVEKKFGVTIAEDDYLALRTLKTFVAFIEKPHPK